MTNLYLCKDIYILLLTKYIDPNTAIKCFQTKFFYDLLSAKERFDISKKAAINIMSKKQMVLWNKYIDEMNKPVIKIKGKGGKNQPENFINCYICQKSIHKNDVPGHIQQKHYYSMDYLLDESTIYRRTGNNNYEQYNYAPGIPSHCSKCGTLRPGGNGPHSANNINNLDINCPFDKPVETNHDFSWLPTYEIFTNKGKIMKELKEKFFIQ